MHTFLERFDGLISGVLNGFDRLVLRGALQSLAFVLGMRGFLWRQDVLLKDFGKYVAQTTELLKEGSFEKAKKLGREIRYLESASICKEEVALEIAQRDGIREGLICVLSSLEPCRAYYVFRNRDTKRLELQKRTRKCLHHYHYFFHPVFGFMHARIQTWFPFTIQVCLNGREWLAQQLNREGLGYLKRDNCFTWLENLPRAQTLCNRQLRADWPKLLGGILRDIHPHHEQIFAQQPRAGEYSWTVFQSEWASDVLFHSRADLEAIYPHLLRHAITTFQGVDVLRFLGHKIPESGHVPMGFSRDVSTNIKYRSEGARIKHWVGDNSLKLYDKGSVLRPEFTMNDPYPFFVLRPKHDDPTGPPVRQCLRKSIEDLPLRAAIGQAANERYLEALAQVQDTIPMKVIAEPLCQPVADVPSQAPKSKHPPGKAAAADLPCPRRVRALNPLAVADAALLTAVGRPEHMLNGLRNRDVCRLLFTEPSPNKQEERRRSLRVTRQLRLLRAHGVITKVEHSHRYQVTPMGRQAIITLLAARDANADLLTANAC